METLLQYTHCKRLALAEIRRLKMFYAAKNSYATETGQGFANTWQVVVFEAKKDRDQYVADATDMATKAIKARQVGEYGGLKNALIYAGRGVFLAQGPNGEFYNAAQA